MAKKKPDLAEVFQGTIVEEIGKVALAGKFTDLPDVAEGSEEAIGELTVFEKACTTLSDQRIAEFNVALKKARASGSFEDETVRIQLRQLKKDHEFCMQMLWHSVHARLDAGDASGLILRKGFKVCKVDETRLIRSQLATLALLGSMVGD